MKQYTVYLYDHGNFHEVLVEANGYHISGTMWTFTEDEAEKSVVAMFDKDRVAGIRRDPAQ